MLSHSQRKAASHSKPELAAQRCLNSFALCTSALRIYDVELASAHQLHRAKAKRCVCVFFERIQSPVSRRSVAGTVAGTVAATVAGLKNAREMHNNVPHKRCVSMYAFLMWSTVGHIPRSFQTGDCTGDCTGD